VVLRPEIELYNEFKLFSEVIVYRKKSPFYFIRFINRLKVEYQLKSLIANASVLFFNSIESLSLVDKFNLNEKKLIFHCHEMPQNIDLEWPWFNEFDKLNLFDVIISDTKISMSLIRNLFRSQDLKNTEFKVIRPILNLEEVEYNKTSINRDFTVGNLATQYMGKGVDVFVQTAIQYCRRYPLDKIVFNFSGPETGYHTQIVRNDIEKSGLLTKIVVRGEVEDVSQFYRSIDLFYLSSRTESYSTSMLEAANYSMPIICFQDAGESSDFAGVIPENVIPYLDIDMVINRIKYYYENRTALIEDGLLVNRHLMDPSSLGDVEEIVDALLN
jgi:glycosyltransferase involved in cell wall biosynthesis